MKRLIDAEWLHLRSLKSTWFTALAVVAFTALVAGADANDGGDFDTFMATLGQMPAIGLGLFAATRSASEFRYGTITHRALAAPRRSQLVAAKVAVAALFAALVTSVTLTAAVIAASVHPSPGDVAAILVGTTLFVSLASAVGFLARNQTTAVLIVFGGWVFEKLVEAVTQAVFLPYGLLGAFAGGQVVAGLALAAVTGAAVWAADTTLTRKDLIT